MSAMHQTLSAMECEQGGFYRTPAGRLVKVTEQSQSKKVCIEFWGKYGLGWQTMWLPSDAPLTPEPGITDFPETTEEAMHYGIPEPEAA